MAKKKTRRKPTSRKKGSPIPQSYVDHVLEHGTRPPSVFKFCTDVGIAEDEFYNQFGSFDGVERSIWRSFITETMARLTGDKTYAGFSSREKVLAFYYTFFEQLKSSRSFILVQLANYRQLELVPEFLKDFKKEFEQYIGSVLNTGKSSGEVARRPYLEKSYPQLLWLHMAFLIVYWRDDASAGFENTDAAIEKSVNLAFDLIGKGAVDAVIDFAKFMYQTKIR